MYNIKFEIFCVPAIHFPVLYRALILVFKKNGFCPKKHTKQKLHSVGKIKSLALKCQSIFHLKDFNCKKNGPLEKLSCFGTRLTSIL
jgi:hypothetical protein